MSVEMYVTLEEAVQQYGLDAKLLTRSVEKGQIRGGKLYSTFVLLEEDTRRVAKQIATKEQLREKVAHLDGKPIGMREAARKYNLNNASISNWAKAGYIRILSSGKPGVKKLVDESDVAYAKELSRIRQTGQGKEVFIQAYLPDWF